MPGEFVACDFRHTSHLHGFSSFLYVSQLFSDNLYSRFSGSRNFCSVPSFHGQQNAVVVWPMQSTFALACCVLPCCFMLLRQQPWLVGVSCSTMIVPNGGLGLT